MARNIISSAPLFHVTDLNRSLDFYCDTLGFTRPSIWGNPPSFAMPDRDGMIIMLAEKPESNCNPDNWDAYFWVNDAKSLFEEFRGKNVDFEYEVTLQELYGNLEFGIKDPDGYFLAFGQEFQEGKVPDNAIQAAPTAFMHMSPILSSADVERDIRWYDEKMGFKVVYSSANYNDADRPIDYAVLGRQNFYIHLQWHAGTEDDPVHAGAVRIQVQNIKPIFEEFVTRGTVPTEKLRENTPWETNEFGFYDLNNNAIFFMEDV